MKKNIKECHPNWPQCFYHVYRILIIGGFGSGKTNALLNLMKQQSEIHMTMMMMNCFCEIVDRQKLFSFISIWDSYQRFLQLQISDTLQARCEPMQNLRSSFSE